MSGIATTKAQTTESKARAMAPPAESPHAVPQDVSLPFWKGLILAFIFRSVRMR
jgi:hypothetical protein